MMTYFQVGTEDKLQWTSNRNTKRFIHENAFENCRLRNGGHFVQGEMS